MTNTPIIIKLLTVINAFLLIAVIFLWFRYSAASQAIVALQEKLAPAPANSATSTIFNSKLEIEFLQNQLKELLDLKKALD